MKKYRTLLFDVDGTMLDFDAAEAQGLREVFGLFGRAELVEDMISTYRDINRKLWDAYEHGTITKSDITDTRFGAVFHAYGITADGILAEQEYRKRLNALAIPIEGIREVLEYLHGKYRLYVVTNGFIETQNRRMADSGLDRYFEKSFISEEVGYQKPQKEFFDACFAQMEGVERETTLIIGDSLHSDMKGGNVAGIDTCWFNPSRAAGDGEVQVDLEIASLKELKELL